MSMEQIIATVRGFDGALVLVPEPGGDFPEISWGDAFFYYAPEGRMPLRTQPYGTIVTRNHPGDSASDLDRAGRWRVNVHVGRAAFADLVEQGHDLATADVVLPHPVYGTLGWICVVNPSERTTGTVVRLLRAAHEAAHARADRRHV